MLDRIGSAAEAVANAVRLVAHDAVSVNPWWLALGMAIYLIGQAVRTRGWFNIIRAAYPEARDLRARDVVAAFFAGSGVNGIVPARGGDVLKLYLVKRRIPGSRYSTLAATFIPEGIPESVFGTALVVWGLARGFLPVPVSAGELPNFDVSFAIQHPILTAIGAGVVIVLAVLLVRWIRRRAEQFVERFRQGLGILRTPRAFVVQVVSWQALGRVIRLGALACFMAAFALPVSLSTAILVMAAQGGGRIIPIAPASAGLRLAMLSYGFVEVTGEAVDIARITAFTVGLGLVQLVVGLVISAAIIGRTFGTLSPRHAVRAARAAFAERERPRLRGRTT
jgi:uncharacterized membrane protein YbhN (UPF0104 family)